MVGQPAVVSIGLSNRARRARPFGFVDEQFGVELAKLDRGS